MIEAVEESHEIAGYELPRIGVIADRVDLILLVGSPGVGDKAVPIEINPGLVRSPTGIGISSQSS